MVRCNLQLKAAKWRVLCFFVAESERCQVLSLGEGYGRYFRWWWVGEDGYTVGSLGIILYYFKSVDRVMVLLTYGLSGILVTS